MKRVFISLAIIIVVGFIAMTIFTGRMVFLNTSQISTNDPRFVEYAMEFFNEISFDYIGFQAQYAIEEVEIDSSFGDHTIPGKLIYNLDKNNDTIIMIHGLGGNHMEILPRTAIFLEHEYNVLVYDQRNAGGNFAQYNTFGFWESYDAADCVAYLDGIIGADKEIHLMGLSQGGATAAIALSHDNVQKRISSVILDSAISNTDDALRAVMGPMNIGLPLDFLMFSGNLYNQLAVGYSYGDVSAVNCLKDTTLPVLILATKADEITPFFIAEKLHTASSGSVLAYVEDSEHIRMFYDYPEWYGEQVFSFLDDINTEN